MLRDKANLALIAAIAIAIFGIAIYSLPTVVKAEGTATTILIRNIENSVDVSLITFPAGDPNTQVTNPSNGQGDTQVLTSTATEASPVAILTSDVSYALWFTITDTDNWDETVASEKLYTQGVGETLDLDGFDAGALEITVWNTPTEATGQALVADINEELYLTVTLENVYGKSGTSKLTVLGEGP